MKEWEEHPHRRLNPLTAEWVLVAPHRTERPWQGQVEAAPAERAKEYDADCYLCPGNPRAGGQRNPPYAETFVFENDFSALKARTPERSVEERGLLVAESERGICRVLCFSPRHDLTLPRMNTAEIGRVVDAWCSEYRELGGLPFIRHVQIFENRGAMMGASNPHPHCQIWASERLPNEALKETRAQGRYREERNGCLLCDYMALEAKQGARMVYENDGFSVVTPFWAVWPFETLLASKRHVGGLDELTAGERGLLADALKQVTTRYDNLFETSFPYTMGFHQRPTDDQPHQEWHLHAHFYPPLLRSATVRKFMVGYEMLAMPQRDLTAEAAAERLRSLSGVHYLDRA